MPDQEKDKDAGSTNDFSVSTLIAELEKTRLNLLTTEDADCYDTTVIAHTFYLEGLATIEAGIQKLKQAEIFRAREYAGNF